MLEDMRVQFRLTLIKDARSWISHTKLAPIALSFINKIIVLPEETPMEDLNRMNQKLSLIAWLYNGKSLVEDIILEALDTYEDIEKGVLTHTGLYDIKRLMVEIIL